MNIVTNLAEWQSIRQNLNGRTIGFVATMGNLHAGHASLVRRANAENEIVVVSIFVNPTQFNQVSDFDKYPRTFAADCELLQSLHVDYLLAPSAEEMYPDRYQIHVSETELSRVLEGEFRPGYFAGMLTVVLKLLNLVQAGRAYFGEKDYQQLLLIQTMVAALFLPVQIIACSTIRADDQLALSSRNARLNPKQREKAARFAQTLQSPKACIEIRSELEAYGFSVEYIEERWQRRLGAVWLDGVRLIDNIAL